MGHPPCLPQATTSHWVQAGRARVRLWGYRLWLGLRALALTGILLLAGASMVVVAMVMALALLILIACVVIVIVALA